MGLEKYLTGFPNGELRESHPFYMADAIGDVPGCLEACLRDELLGSLQKALENVKPKRVFTVGCGTSCNAAKAVAYMTRTYLRIPAAAYDALDFQTDLPCGVDSSALVLSFSHSGSALATCLAQEKAKSLGAFTVGISGNPNSRLSTGADLPFVDPYQGEIPYGKTRSYLGTSLQGMLVVMMTASPSVRDAFIADAKKMVVALGQNMEKLEKAGEAVAGKWYNVTDHYMLAGFGCQKTNADEIKLKIIEVIGEISASFGLEEFAHGPSAAFRKDLGIILFQTDRRVVSRALELAKGAAAVDIPTVIITNQPALDWPENADVIEAPATENEQQFGLFPAAVAAQYLMYYLAVKKGLIPDINGMNIHPELMAVNDIYFPPGTH